MKVIQKALRVGEEYYVTHLTVINPFLNIKLSSKEIEVLAAFMEIKGELVEDDRFNTIVRKKVRDKLGLSSAGLSNYLKTMQEKGHLIKNEFSHRITIAEYLIPSEGGQGYQFKILA